MFPGTTPALATPTSHLRLQAFLWYLLPRQRPACPNSARAAWSCPRVLGKCTVICSKAAPDTWEPRSPQHLLPLPHSAPFQTTGVFSILIPKELWNAPSSPHLTAATLSQADFMSCLKCWPPAGLPASPLVSHQPNPHNSPEDGPAGIFQGDRTKG